MSTTSREPAIDTIDLVFRDDAARECLLVIVETRRWSGTISRMRELVKRVGAYVSFGLHRLHRRYPGTRGYKVTIRLDTLYEPDEPARRLLDRVGRAVQRMGLEFSVGPLEEAFAVD
jgi:hypothetical protein